MKVSFVVADFGWYGETKGGENSRKNWCDLSYLTRGKKGEFQQRGPAQGEDTLQLREGTVVAVMNCDVNSRQLGYSFGVIQRIQLYAPAIVRESETRGPNDNISVRVHWLYLKGEAGREKWLVAQDVFSDIHPVYIALVTPDLRPEGTFTFSDQDRAAAQQARRSLTVIYPHV